MKIPAIDEGLKHEHTERHNCDIMRILAIETSCDESAIAIVESDETAERRTFRVLASTTLSQAGIHKEYGGVFPAVAKREHAKALVPLLIRTLSDAGLYKKTSRHVIEHPLRPDFQEILEREPDLFARFISEVPHIDPPKLDAIAVTQGPGLEPALWVGINFARALSLIWKTPVIPVNHMEGHFFAGLIGRSAENTKEEYVLANAAFPVLGLLVSGGHTELVLSPRFGTYERIGETRDDAVGEAFDKVARLLGLPYPGGPEIARLAKSGRSGIHPLPRPMLASGDADFSFAGLKTAVLYLVKRLGELSEQDKADIAREFEDACIEVLVEKTIRAAKEHGASTLVVGGGVSANVRLRETLLSTFGEKLPHIPVSVPPSSLSTDNALMIAIAAFFSEKRAKPEALRATGNWRIGEEV